MVFSAHLKDLKTQYLNITILPRISLSCLKKHLLRLPGSFYNSTPLTWEHPEYLGANDIQLGKKESTEDTAKVLGQYVDRLNSGSQPTHGKELAEFQVSSMEWSDRRTSIQLKMLADYLIVQENLMSGRLDYWYTVVIKQCCQQLRW